MTEEQQRKLVELHQELNNFIQRAYHYLDNQKFQQSAMLFNVISSKSSDMAELINIINNEKVVEENNNLVTEEEINIIEENISTEEVNDVESNE